MQKIQMKSIGLGFVFTRKLAALLLATTFMASSALSDPYIRDDISDTGAEPNPSSGAMWTSPDIWVRNDPMPGWNPLPYNIATPPVWLDTTHFNPDYRSPMSGKPNYIYVRVRNRNAVSSASDRLTLYWASASTGLAWDPAKTAGSFVDNVQGGVLFGSEVTKPRKNAATATPTERAAYLAAIKKIATNPAFKFMGDPRPMFTAGRSYWHTQQEIHRFGPTNRHGFSGGAGNPWIPSVAFLPWHREFVNRYEGMLQEADPTVKLLYWDWTTNPVTGPLDYSNNFMGNFGAGAPATAPAVGAPLSPDLDAAYPTDASQGLNGSTQVHRRQQPPGTPLAQSDVTVLNRVPYSSSGASANTAFSGGIESLSHNNSHVYVASVPQGAMTIADVGDQLFQPYAARDPFFFLLHAKVDELWARWQRKSGTLANLDPATTFGTSSADPNITGAMGPWNGVAVQSDGLANALTVPEMAPWTPGGGQIYAKPANDRSVISPPFYDTAPLTIPVLQPGQEAILEIPWYPPNPNGFGAITDPQHVCLVARIETTTASPFGMTTAETADINANTKANNNIAWRNVSVVDSFPGPFKKIHVMMANGFTKPINGVLRIDAKLDTEAGQFLRQGGTLRVNLGKDLLARWHDNGARIEGLKLDDRGFMQLNGTEARIEGIQLKPGEQFPVDMEFVLNKDYKPSDPHKPINLDIVQVGTPDDPGAVVGGQRYMIYTDKIVLVEKGRVWRWHRADDTVRDGWATTDFRDNDWFERKLDLGWVEPPANVMRMQMPMNGGEQASAYLFRKSFTVDDPSFFKDLKLRIKRSDGAVAYLNGKEVYRSNVGGDMRVAAEKVIPQIERDAYFPVRLDPSLLRQGENILAVEIHPAKDNKATPTFDAELVANEQAPVEPPAMAISNMQDGALVTEGKKFRLKVDALAPESKIKGVRVVVDGKAVASLTDAPFTFALNGLRRGTHRLQVTAFAEDGSQTEQFITVNAVKVVPPSVSIVEPAEHLDVAAGQATEIRAEASDPAGKITKVEFYIHDSYIIGAPGRLLGTVTAAPYSIKIDKLEKPHAMVVAVAYNDRGERTVSAPIMLLLKP